MTKGVLHGAVAVIVLLTLACGKPEPDASTEVRPSPQAANGSQPLTRADLESLLAVRAKALQRLEESLDEVLRSGGDVATRVKELSAAEREAAAALGVEWRRYMWVREEVARLMTLQRQEEDTVLLKAELEKAREELDRQLKVARDRASREFLEAQRLALDRQHAKLMEAARASPTRAEALALLESFRAEIAQQQSRQEKLQRRLREILLSARTAGTMAPH